MFSKTLLISLPDVGEGVVKGPCPGHVEDCHDKDRQPVQSEPDHSVQMAEHFVTDHYLQEEG